VNYIKEGINNISMQGKELRKYTLTDYNQVIRLKKRGFSQNQIKEKIGVSSTTVWYWANTKRKPRFLYAKRKQRKLSLSAKKLSKELAYIFGVLIGDGSLEITKLNNRINLLVKDKDFAIYFFKTLKRWSRLEPLISKRRIKESHQTKYGDWIKTDSIVYTVRLNSIQAINFLKDKINCRTYNWKVPLMIKRWQNKRIIGAFLKGFFDSEGSAILHKRCRRIDARILNPNNSLQDIQILLKKLEIRSTMRPSARDTYIIRILDQKSLAIFSKKIGFTIKRKKRILEKMLKSYKREPFDGEKTKKTILSCLKKKPKTIREISLKTKKHYNTIKYHIKNLNGIQVKVTGKLKEGSNISNLWSLI